MPSLTISSSPPIGSGSRLQLSGWRGRPCPQVQFELGAANFTLSARYFRSNSLWPCAETCNASWGVFIFTLSYVSASSERNRYLHNTRGTEPVLAYSVNLFAGGGTFSNSLPLWAEGRFMFHLALANVRCGVWLVYAADIVPDYGEE